MKSTLFLIFAMLMVLVTSCDTTIEAFMPQGPKGDPGLSAYELWLEELNSGRLDWDKNESSITHFFLYLSGKNGIDGKNGENGQSAYELWKLLVSQGTLMDDKTDTAWPSDKTTIHDFFEYLSGTSGTNGKSALEIWEAAVAAGLEDPHNPGHNWPSDQIGEENFFKYLQGEDGKDGQDGKDGEIGKPGEPVKIIDGVPNVIAQYSVESYSEFVNWQDGSVAYKVYDDQGLPAPNAEVSGIPGLPGKVYIADANGRFVVPKEDLPVNLNSSDRFGSTSSVTYMKSTGEQVTEPSANNTYVPNRMQVRITVTAVPTLTSTISIPVKVERRTDPSRAWESIPSYLGNLTQIIRTCEITNDPSVYDFNKYWSTVSTNISTVTAVSVTRPSLRCDYLELSYQQTNYKLWDEQDHYINVVMDSYYGERVHAPAVIKVPPIQFMPTLKSITVTGYNDTDKTFKTFSGELDVTSINHDICFNTSMAKGSMSAYDYYYPTTRSISTLSSLRVTLSITISGTAVSMYNSTYNTIANPVCNINVITYLGSSISLTSGQSSVFLSSPTLGTLAGNPVSGFYINKAAGMTDKISDIVITHVN